MYASINMDDGVKLGYLVRNENGNDRLMLVVVETTKGVGFPKFEGTPSIDKSSLDLANACLQSILYITKGFHAETVDQLVDLVIPQGTLIATAGQNYYKYSNLTHTFNEMNCYDVLPNLLLSLSGKKLRVPLPPEILQSSGT